MRARLRHRRGFVLAAVLIVMTVIIGMTATLAANAGSLYRQRRGEEVRMAARTLTDSAAVWARKKPPEDSSRLQLDTGRVLPANMSGSVTLTLKEVHGKPVWHIETQVRSGTHQAVSEVEVPAAAATRPA